MCALLLSCAAVSAAVGAAFPGSRVQRVEVVAHGYDQLIAVVHSQTLDPSDASTASPSSTSSALPPICVLRQARAATSSAFHCPPLTVAPALQAALLGLLKRLLPPATAALLPAPLFCSSSAPPLFLVEVFVPGCDLSTLLPLPPAPLRPLFGHIGRCLRHLHSIRCSQFGAIEAISGDSPLGRLPSWASVFSAFRSRLRLCPLSPLLTSSLLHLYHAQLPFLTSFDQPCLVHSDVNSSNIRVIATSPSSSPSSPLLQLSGLIDFGDAQAGDGLYDVGRLLSHWKGDWAVVEWVECGYLGEGGCQQQQRQWSEEERGRIRFYAASFAVWMLSHHAGTATTDCQERCQCQCKYVDILERLMQPALEASPVPSNSGDGQLTLTAD